MHKDQKPLVTYRLNGMRKHILELLEKGHELSELDGLTHSYGTSFRTRISELKAMGYDINSYFDKSGRGASYKRYHMKERGWLKKQQEILKQREQERRPSLFDAMEA